MIAEPRLRVVCIREIEDTIIKYEAQDAFRVLNTHIETPQGGVILFQGMATHTADSIKSLEGFSCAYVEEAQSLSQRSLDLLRPTIREEGSTLMFAWNPNQPSDPVDMLLRGESVPPNSVVVGANYNDNPWFPEVLRAELEWDKRRDFEKFQHVWRGAYQKGSEARVFKNWRIEEFDTPVDTIHYMGADWGFSVDPSVLIRCHVNGRTLYIDHEAYRIGVEIDYLGQLFDTVPGAREWPIVADSARPETISYLNRNGFPRMESAQKGKDSVKEGVAFLQNYDIRVHPRCIHTIDELGAYSFKTDKLSGMVTPFLQDMDNHVIDSLRYAVERLRKAPVDEWFTL
jgi:phage terminase large subunit